MFTDHPVFSLVQKAVLYVTLQWRQFIRAFGEEPRLTFLTCVSPPQSTFTTFRCARCTFSAARVRLLHSQVNHEKGSPCGAVETNIQTLVSPRLFPLQAAGAPWTSCLKPSR